ncbi:peptidoglycan/LPS O-acetylase OafA/YrhL [Bradyrhizobium sp. GM22.5]
MHRRLAFIDTLRGIAVLAVLFQHVFEVIVQKHPTGAYYWVFHDAIGYYMNFGRFGVVLFFFVSGFVIPFSFPDSATPVRDFTISRFFRLYPAYWTSMVIGLVTMQVLEANAYPLSQVIANVTMLQTFVNIPNLWIFYWTLAIELLFYVGCTILFAMGLLNRRFTAVAIVIAAALVGTAAALLIESRTVSSLMEVGLNLSAMFLGKGHPRHRHRRKAAMAARRRLYGVLCDLRHHAGGEAVRRRLSGELLLQLFDRVGLCLRSARLHRVCGVR